MLEDDPGGQQALGPRGLDIVLAQGVQHGGAGQAGNIAHGVKAQGQTGHQVGLGPLGGVKNNVDAHEFKGRPIIAEKHQQEGGHHEAGHGHTQGTHHP